MTTQKNLQDAFAGESQANRKYLAFANAAEKEGRTQIARLFRAVAEAETIHAHAHLRVLEGVKNTEENLKEAMAGEAYEFKTMYPEFLTVAQQEQNKKAEISFRYALAVEETHHGLFQQALQAAQSGQDLPAAAVYICPVCGHTVIGEVHDRCPVCNTLAEKFFEVK